MVTVVTVTVHHGVHTDDASYLGGDADGDRLRDVQRWRLAGLGGESVHHLGSTGRPRVDRVRFRFDPSRPYTTPEVMAHHSVDHNIRGVCWKTTQPSALQSNHTIKKINIDLDMQRIPQSTNVCRLYFCLAV